MRLQCVPDAREGDEVAGDRVDPLGEVAHEVAPHLVQRYPDRALLLATDRCAVYCRFCTRSRMVGAGEGPTPLRDLEPALAWLRAHPEVRDVILSGGDPLTLATDRLVRLVEAVRAVPSVETIRVATRVPVTLPMRITQELVDALRPHHPLWVMTHFNHPKELTDEAREACRVLVDGGFPVNNQTVLLAGVNDAVATLERLFRGLVRQRVRPYYLLQADPVRGTGHLRTPLHRGVELLGGAPRATDGHRAAQAHLRYAGRAREGPARSRLRGGAGAGADDAADVPRGRGRVRRPPGRARAWPRLWSLG